MIQCGSCRRHIRAFELVCPFCDDAQRSTSAAGAKGMLAFAAMTVLGVSACSSNARGNGDDGHETTGVSGTMTTTMSATTQTSTDTGETSTESGSLTFVPDEDIIAVYGGCDPFAQDCPDSEKCVAYGSTGGWFDANKCVPVLGDLGPGETCSYGGRVEATDDCDADSYCWNAQDVDGQLLGVCAPFCAGWQDDPMCPGSSTCLIAFEGSVALCVDTCDPLAQDCPPALGCHYNEAGEDFVCLPGDIPPGAGCALHGPVCAPGHTCVAAELLPMCADPGCCTPFCDLDNPGCSPGTDCVSFFDPDTAPAGLEAVGICVVP